MDVAPRYKPIFDGATCLFLGIVKLYALQRGSWLYLAASVGLVSYAGANFGLPEDACLAIMYVQA